MSADLAEACAPYVTSVVLSYDVIPRFSLSNVERLRDELLSVDWYEEMKDSMLQMEYMQVSTVC